MNNYLNEFDTMPLPTDPETPGREIAHQCTAHSKRSGERCRKPSLFGETTCEKHGSNGLSKAKVQRRLAALVPTALDVLEDEMEVGPVCESCGRGKNNAAALKAAQMVLDRAGHGPSASLKVSREEAAQWTAWLTNEELEQARALRDAAINRMDAGDAPVGDVREFDIPEGSKEVWLPKSDRLALPEADDVIEAVFTRTEGQ